MDYFKGLSRKEYIIKVSELIKRDGINNISIRKIAKELDCSSASLYRYFSSLDELIYYSELGELKTYIISLNRASLVWKNVWDKYVGVWYCYAMEAFRKPITYNLLFLIKKDIKLNEAIGEYYDMFPEDILKSSPVFQTMLRNPDFFGRDYEMCKLCINDKAIDKENAIILNRMVCLLYMGYLKNILDNGVEKVNIDEYVFKFINDIERIVKSLALDMKGYNTYNEVLARRIKW